MLIPSNISIEIRMPAVRQAGVGMIEVLVTLVILAIGLLGLAGLQVKANSAEMESYQRSQALALVRYMVDMVQAGRGNPQASPRISDFSTLASTDGSIFYGVGSTQCASTNPANLTPAQQSVCQWHTALQGAAETTAGTNAGAMIGARGCLIAPTTPTSGAIADFYVVVVWQGLSPTVDPPSNSPGDLCAKGVNFNSTTTGYKRAVATRVLVECQTPLNLSGQC